MGSPIRSALSPRLLAVENPKSGRGDRKSLKELLRPLEKRGWNLEYARPESSAETRALGRTAMDYDLIVLSGGDGTLSEFIQERSWEAPPIGLIPRGTANVVARDLGIPFTENEAARLLAEGTPRPIDIGQMTFPDGATRRFVLSVSAGIPAEAVANLSPRLKRLTGRMAFLPSTLKALVSSPPIAVRVQGENFSGYFAAITLTRHYAGGFVMIPESQPGDGLFDIVVARDRRSVLGLAARLLRGGEAGGPGITVRRAAEVEILSTGALESDGDEMRNGPVMLKIPGCIDIVAI